MYRIFKKRGKFNNVETMYRGVLYRSKAEAHYAMFLDDEVARKRIAWWRFEDHIKLEVNGKLVTTYLVDFTVGYPDGHVEYHEMKGVWTAVATLKVKLFRALFPDRYLKVIKSKEWS